MAERTHTFLFADLVGYTALTEAHGDDVAADAAAGFCNAVRFLLQEYEAEEIKAIGDALMLRCAEPLPAARLAERIVCDHGSRHRELGISIGMHTGTAVRRGADWFGSAVNLAARVADVAGAGEVVLTEATRGALGDFVGVRSLGRRTLKNVAEPVELFELALGTELAPRSLSVDPVCRMAVDPTRTVERQSYRGVEHHFCSSRCLAAFDDDPALYSARSR